MDWSYPEMKDYFTEENNRRLLLKGSWGMERETQRVTASGDLALTDHPEEFGHKLANPYITTDFAESQLELVTPPFNSVEETYKYLVSLHEYVEQYIKNEILWPLSMPPRLPDEENIPAARFNNTPQGHEKEIYRRGLALRYGKKMQMISGLHYNFSFSEELLANLYKSFGGNRDIHTFINDTYFAVARNYLRYRWLLIYLFGASPTMDPTYYPVVSRELKTVFKCCPECCNITEELERYACSLRVSRFGYSNINRPKDNVSYNSLKEYMHDVRKLLSLKNPKYEKLGIYRDGQQVQLNTNILQRESEFYSSIRFKQITKKSETQLEAMEDRGVKYLEVRILDLNPFERVGISLEQLRFLQVFMLFCLFEASPLITDSELEKVNKNHHLTALSGRKPGLKLYKYDNGPTGIKKWGTELFERLRAIAALLDRASGSYLYESCIDAEYEKLQNPSLLPSAKILREMKENSESFIEFGVRLAKSNSGSIKDELLMV